jgi:hypothetical protein
MRKYGKYTGNQVEDILDKVGGELAIDGLIAGMLEIVLRPVPGTNQDPVTRVCERFGTRCSICGTFFDDGEVCQHGHEVGKHYALAL